MSELKTVTLQEENTGINLHDCGSDNDLSEVTSKVYVTTEKKKDTPDCTKKKDLCDSKDTIRRVKTEPTEMVETFVSHPMASH